MLETRVMPCLLLKGRSLIKTKKFGKFDYIGDPINAVSIYNELEVDELVLLDIYASTDGKEPNFDLLKDIASHCFMPVAYGGGISTIEQAEKIFDTGFEKVVLNTNALRKPDLISSFSKRFGSQSIVISVDVKKSILGNYHIHNTNVSDLPDLTEWIKQVEKLGAGELFITSVDNEGMWSGLDKELGDLVNKNTQLPIVLNGGAKSVQEMAQIQKETGIDAYSAGSLFVYQKKNMGVLVNYPSRKTLANIFERTL